MNIAAQERKVYNKIKFLQIPEDELTPENFAAAAYYAGILDGLKIITPVHRGELTDHQVDVELAKLDSATRAIN